LVDIMHDADIIEMGRPGKRVSKAKDIKERTSCWFCSVGSQLG
jgi:hypothetical protein